MLTPLFVWQTQSSNFADFSSGLEQAFASEAKSLLILSCSQNNYPEQAVSSLLMTAKTPVFGGIYPMLTLGETLQEHGAIIVGLSIKMTVSNFTNLTETSQNPVLLEQYIESDKNLKIHSDFLMFYDGLMKESETFIETLYESLDHEITIAGGGAGNLDFIRRPCVFTNQGLFFDIVQIVALSAPIHLGVGHGWEILTGPFLVSESTDHIVESLNYTPAYKLYKETVESLSDYRFSEDEFFNIAKNFPLGIAGINEEILVRDPIISQDNGLQCVGNIPENSMIYILKGQIPSLISSAEQAAIKAQRQSSSDAFAMLFDCISRVLYMKDGFTDELSAIVKATQSKSVFGAISIGEIANDANGIIRLLNKSTVVGCS